MRARSPTRCSRSKPMPAPSRLSAFDVVVKSPGISPYRPEALLAAQPARAFVGGTALWFAEHADPGGVAARTVCVTGTKGKSTTTALLAHLLRAGGHRTALAGNIGLPLLELLDPEARRSAGRSSCRATRRRDVAASGVRPRSRGGAQHLSRAPRLARQRAALRRRQAGAADRRRSRASRCSTLQIRPWPHCRSALGRDAFTVDGARPQSRPRGAPTKAKCTGSAARTAGTCAATIVYRGDVAVFDTRDVPLPGRHNRGNLCAALTAIEALGLDAAALAPHAATFVPLPHRLQTLGTRDGIAYVNDSISTTPHASLAALDVLPRPPRRAAGRRPRPRHRLVGVRAGDADARAGGDRDHGRRTGRASTSCWHRSRADAGFHLLEAGDLADAVAQARAALAGEGVMLLSPGAPSFGAYRDYTERGRHFAAHRRFRSRHHRHNPRIGHRARERRFTPSMHVRRLRDSRRHVCRAKRIPMRRPSPCAPGFAVRASPPPRHAAMQAKPVEWTAGQGQLQRFPGLRRRQQRSSAPAW